MISSFLKNKVFQENVPQIQEIKSNPIKQDIVKEVEIQKNDQNQDRFVTQKIQFDTNNIIHPKDKQFYQKARNYNVLDTTYKADQKLFQDEVKQNKKQSLDHWNNLLNQSQIVKQQYSPIKMNEIRQKNKARIKWQKQNDKSFKVNWSGNGHLVYDQQVSLQQYYKIVGKQQDYLNNQSQQNKEN